MFSQKNGCKGFFRPASSDVYFFYCLIIFSKSKPPRPPLLLLRRLRLGLSCRKPKNDWNCRLRKLRLPSAARRKAKCGNFKHHAPFFNCGAADFRRSSALAAKQPDQKLRKRGIVKKSGNKFFANALRTSSASCTVHKLKNPVADDGNAILCA